ncbi:conjugal transfer protein TrbJ [Burkholderia cenocepacia]|uniref:conjugal transfer protein TrbJ n=1 Tax=Burkholderia cenocepacia TaxID=95486 RepID=UPI0022318042|nr:conjugal transfer protein TrbJ [Burkholderia cenocepacia]
MKHSMHNVAMVFSRPQLSAFAVAAALYGALLTPPPAVAGGGGFGGATEITQLLNHGELIASVAQQAQMVVQNVEAQIQRIQQTLNSLQNLRQLPQQMLDQVLAPYRSQISQYTQLYNSVKNLYTSAKDVGQLFGRSMSEMSNLNMSPKQWLSAYSSLASSIGGTYKQQYQQDMSAIQALADRAANLQQIQAAIPGVSGAVQGLQLLTQQSNVLAGEMVDMHALMARSAAQDSKDRGDDAQARANSARLAQARAAKMDDVIDKERQSINAMPTLKPLSN